MLERHQSWLILGFRFLYGLRNITPFAIGMSRVPTRRFVVLNIVGAAIWAVTFACGGYLFGVAMEAFFLGQQKWFVIIGAAAFAAVLWVARMIRSRLTRKEFCLDHVEKTNA